MGLDKASADHVCNAVRRQAAEEFPDLTIVFVICDSQTSTPDKLEWPTFLKSPPKELLWPRLSKKPGSSNDDSHTLIGLQIKKQWRFPFLFPRIKKAAFFLIRRGRFDTTEELREACYACVWQAQALIENYKMRHTEMYEVENDFVYPIDDTARQCLSNGLGAAFSSFVLEQGKRNSIKALAHKQAGKTLSAVLYYEAEKHPFPLFMESAQLIYQEFSPGAQEKLTPLSTAHQMTKALAEVISKATIYQWIDFCETAQEMAWMGQSKNHILGTAVFTSEDVYTRSIAYLLADILSMEPVFPSDLKNYNAFAHSEMNERHHIKQCEENMHAALEKVKRQNTLSPLSEEIQRQNGALLKGAFFGWCVDCLLEVRDVMAKNKDLEHREKKRLAIDHFNLRLQQQSWSALHSFSQALWKLRRNHEGFGLDVVLENCHGNSEFQTFCDALLYDQK